MITVRRVLQIFDDPPFLLFDREEAITEVSSFLRQLLLRGMAATTLRAYAYDLLDFYRFMSAADISLNKLKPAHAIRFLGALRKKNAAARTINRRITVVRSFLNTVKPAWGNAVFASSSSRFYKGQRNHALIGPLRIKNGVPATMRVKVPTTLTFPLQTDAVHVFITQLRSYRDRAIVALMLCLGLRSCEILNMHTTDIDFDHAQLRVRGKGDKQRLLPISPWIASTLVSYLNLERPEVTHATCFVVLKGARRGNRLLPEGLRKIFRYRRHGALKNAHPHRFRHTFCTNLIRHHVPLPIVQQLMGHASVNTTLLYINLSMEDVAAEYHKAMDELANIDAHENA